MRISDWSSDVCSSDLRADRRDAAIGDRAHDDLFVERPQILDRPATARDDDQVGARHRPTGRDGVEAANRIRDLRRRPITLNQTRPADDMRRSEKRRVGKEWLSTGQYRWSPKHNKKKKKH